MGGHAVALIAVPIFWLVGGTASGLSALVAAVGTLAFMGIGQAIQVRLADAPPQRMMIAWLASYVVRVGVPGLVLLLVTANPERLVGMDRRAVAVCAVVVVLGWRAAGITACSRRRIPVFDQSDDTAQ